MPMECNFSDFNMPRTIPGLILNHGKLCLIFNSLISLEPSQALNHEKTLFLQSIYHVFSKSGQSVWNKQLDSRWKYSKE